MKEEYSSNRTVYLDYLRVFATYAVMILHIASQNWYAVDLNGSAWQVFNFFDGITRWVVPAFIMISGSLFLDRDIPVKKLYTKYIFRLIIAFVVWSVIYALFIQGSLSTRVSAVLQGHYHMYFLFLIIGLYMCVPLIKAFTEKTYIVRYYLVLVFVFAFLIPEILMLIYDFGNELSIKGADIISRNVSFMNMKIVLGYAGFFVLGYVINKKNISKRLQGIIYLLGIAGFIATVVLESAVVLKTQSYSENYYGHFTVNVLFETIAVFTWFKYRKYNWPRMNVIIQKMAKYSFGAYLIHALIIELLNTYLGLNTLSFHPVLSVVCISVITFVTSFAVSAVLNQIPVVKKYVV